MKYNKQILLRVDSKLKEDAQKASESEGLTLTAWIRRLIILALKSNP